jgi:hypothetical protein
MIGERAQIETAQITTGSLRFVVAVGADRNDNSINVLDKTAKTNERQIAKTSINEFSGNNIREKTIAGQCQRYQL